MPGGNGWLVTVGGLAGPDASCGGAPLHESALGRPRRAVPSLAVVGRSQDQRGWRRRQGDVETQAVPAMVPHEWNHLDFGAGEDGDPAA